MSWAGDVHTPGASSIHLWFKDLRRWALLHGYDARPLDPNTSISSPCPTHWHWTRSRSKQHSRLRKLIKDLTPTLPLHQQSLSLQHPLLAVNAAPHPPAHFVTSLVIANATAMHCSRPRKATRHWSQRGRRPTKQKSLLRWQHTLEMQVIIPYTPLTLSDPSNSMLTLIGMQTQEPLLIWSYIDTGFGITLRNTSPSNSLTIQLSTLLV